eukprot:TRINITY_DN5549_c0_g3_i2.p1 TRINITY_DN5549_c0_g3~~TRINITY_DN5549_c0_g3_i2.p1  ORF type:complete len:748 (+),score=180.38 TRINITY_DN5549_c0_g3_i2:257-2245(+)
MAHRPNHTVGLFWLNSAETWIDVERSSGSGGLLSSLFSNSISTNTETHWMSESGIIDVFFFPGPNPTDVFRQFTSLVGRQELPPLFALGYHQCRWNYQDETDVANVNGKFEEHDIPYDVLWLDIEHTDGKRYFTWDGKKFPSPQTMIQNLAVYGRKMVTIVDPHIKRDGSYSIHLDAERNGLYVKNSGGNGDYEGHCWPGGSSWIDYTSPEARKWWISRFEYDKYVGSGPTLFTWNDMNEPSVFSGPEVTMKKDAIHYGGWEHRDVHNIYGMLMHRATAEGLVQRNEAAKLRPFVLSRAFFAGSQRWGAIWTGDNNADWSHLEASVPMLLSLGIAGITFSGADVGGFFGNPSPELLLRWYQVGAFQPFFRGHAHIDTKRREPWMHGDPWTGLIKNAITTRYSYLPYLYTTFYESSTTGKPVIRPLWVEFPTDSNTFSLQSSFLLGSSLLVTPVTKEGQVTTNVYLPTATSTTTTTTTTPTPGVSTKWYDLSNSNECHDGGREVTVSTPLDRISVFQRGGTIVPRKFRLRRSSRQMHSDPVTLVVALGISSDGSRHVAEGSLYDDDGETYDYLKEGARLFMNFDYQGDNKKATLRGLSVNPHQIQSSEIERIIIIGVSSAASRVSSSTAGFVLPLDSEWVSGALTIKKPGCSISRNFTIDIEF